MSESGQSRPLNAVPQSSLAVSSMLEHNKKEVLPRDVKEKTEAVADVFQVYLFCNINS